MGTSFSCRVMFSSLSHRRHGLPEKCKYAWKQSFHINKMYFFPFEQRYAYRLEIIITTSESMKSLNARIVKK